MTQPTAFDEEYQEHNGPKDANSLYVQYVYDESADGDNKSDYDNVILYCGYVFDYETGQYLVRNRIYHPLLGRWNQRDPLGYVDGMGLYEYVRSGPVTRRDPSGLFPLVWVPSGLLDGVKVVMARRFIAMLGSDQWEVRDAASTSLRAMGRSVCSILREARHAADDEEIRLRLDMLLLELDCRGNLGAIGLTSADRTKQRHIDVDSIAVNPNPMIVGRPAGLRFYVDASRDWPMPPRDFPRPSVTLKSETPDVVTLAGESTTVFLSLDEELDVPEYPWVVVKLTPKKSGNARITMRYRVRDLVGRPPQVVEYLDPPIEMTIRVCGQ